MIMIYTYILMIYTYILGGSYEHLPHIVSLCLPTRSFLTQSICNIEFVTHSVSWVHLTHVSLCQPTPSSLRHNTYIQRRVRDRVRDNTKFVTEFVTHSVSSVHLNTYIRMLIDGELSVDRQTDRCNNTLLFGSNTLTSQSIRLPIWGAYD